MTLPRIGLLAFLPLFAHAQEPVRPEVRVSSESTPPGATVQLKLFLTTARPVLSGSLSLSLDPAFFGDISSVAIFSAAGDASGEADLQGRRVTLKFASPTAGIGRLTGLPVAVINVPLLASLRPGASVSATASAPTAWKDYLGVDFTPEFRASTVTAAGALSVRALSTGIEILPKDGLLTLDGTGFTPATSVEIDSAAVAETAFVSATQLRVKLAGPATISGKRFRVRNPSGDSVDYFPSQINLPSTAWLPAGYRPLLPLQVATDWSGPGEFGAVGSSSRLGILIQNPHPTPVEVTIKGLGLRSIVIGRTTRILQSGQTAVIDVVGLVPGSFSTQISAAAPIRAAWLRTDDSLGPSLTLSSPLRPPFAQLSTDLSELNWEWRTGAPAPEARQLHVCSFSEELNYSVKAVTSSGGAWLSAPASGRSVIAIRGCFALGNTAPAIDIRVDPTGLQPGVYTGTLTLTPEGDRPVPVTVSVRLQVTDKPFLSASLATVHFNWELGKDPPPPITLEISSNGEPATFTANTAFAAGPPWLTVAPASGTAPAPVVLTLKPAGLAIGEYTATLLIRGPANTLTIPVTASVYGPPTPRPATLSPSPDSARFSWQRGSEPPQPLRISFPPIVLPVSFTVRTATPGDTWLSAFPIDGPGVAGIGIRVDPATLPDGVYRGAVVIRSENPDLVVEPVALPVELTVWSQAPALTVSPASLDFTLAAGSPPASAKLSITTGAVAVPFTVTQVVGSPWFGARMPSQTPMITPAELTVDVFGSNLPPGTYSGALRITAGGRSVDVPIRLVKTGLELRPNGPPFIGAIVNGASAQSGPISPGNIVTLHGYPLAPLDSARRDIRVLFDGVPAPLLYVSPSQINVVVPYQVAGRQSTVVEVEAQPLSATVSSTVFDRSPAQTVPVTPSAPALFTLSGTGAGQAAALDQDNTLNGPQSPAGRGSVLQLFGTGEGLLSPPQETGAIADSASPRPVLPVRVSIGGVEAQVLYAGPSPGSIFGLVQVNAVVPAVAPGPAVPVTLRIGDTTGPDNVTIAVK